VRLSGLKIMHTKPVKRLYRSPSDRIIAGVCSGTADYLGTDVTLVRVLWALSFFLQGLGLVAYIACLVLVPMGEGRISQRTRRSDTELIIGIALIAAGLLLFLNRTFDLFWPWFDLWFFQWHIIWPVLLIGFGLWLILRSSGRGRAGAEGALPFYREGSDRMLAGVCSGLAASWRVDVSVVRVVYVLLTVYTHVILGIVAYLLLFILTPERADG